MFSKKLVSPSDSPPLWFYAIFFTIGGVYFIASALWRGYYSSPKKRLNWHNLNEDNVRSIKIDPQPVNITKATITEFVDVARTDTLELIDDMLIAKSGDGTVITQISIGDIDRVKAPSPGGLLVFPKNEKNTSFIKDGRIQFEFGKKMRSVVGLPSLPLVKSWRKDLQEADKKTLAFYFSIVNPVDSIPGDRAQRPTYLLAWADFGFLIALIMIIILVVVIMK